MTTLTSQLIQKETLDPVLSQVYGIIIGGWPSVVVPTLPRSYVWWPNIDSNIERTVHPVQLSVYEICTSYSSNSSLDFPSSTMFPHSCGLYWSNFWLPKFP